MTLAGHTVRDGLVRLRPAGSKKNGTGQLSVPSFIARAIPTGSVFKAELTDEGILYRYIGPPTDTRLPVAQPKFLR